MNTATTEDIRVSVETFYQEELSRPETGPYVFGYRITIENTSSHTVQLLRRHWVIFDSLSERQEVEGEGVIGQQPILEPGMRHQYSSSCPLSSELGKMEGEFVMQRMEDNSLFTVKVPDFILSAPARLN